MNARRTGWIWTAGLVISALLSAFSASWAEEGAFPETIRLFNQTIFQEHRKGPVILSHLKHTEQYKVLCRDCHHVFENRQNVWKEGDPVQKCDTCHKANKDPRVDKLQNAFHKNCRSCHRDIGKGPYKTCGDCHEELRE